MNTGDRDTARRILEFCHRDARLESDIEALTGLRHVTVRKRINNLAKRGLVTLTKLNDGDIAVKATEKSTWMMVAPNEVAVESMRVLELLNVQKRTIAELIEITGEPCARVRDWVYHLGRSEHIIGYPSTGHKRQLVYQLTGKGERLLVKVKGGDYMPPRRVSSVFNLGAFLNQ